jgi:hypothetical protein
VEHGAHVLILYYPPPQVKAAVEGSIEELQETRKTDPLEKLIPRTILSTLELWDGT